MPLHKPYTDIPGTTIFDADMARKGHHLNQRLRMTLIIGWQHKKCTTPQLGCDYILIKSSWKNSFF